MEKSSIKQLHNSIVTVLREEKKRKCVTEPGTARQELFQWASMQ